MTYHTHFLKPWQRLTLWLLTLPLVVGIVICSYGWITSNLFLITLFPEAPLIHPITLVCFFLSVFIFWMVLLSFRLMILICSILLTGIAAISLIENYFLLDSYLNYPLSYFTSLHFEYLAYQCGLAFLTIGIIFLIIYQKKLRLFQLITIPLLLWVVLSLAQLSIVYYIFFKSGVSILDHLTMSLPTTLGLIYFVAIIAAYTLFHVYRLYPDDLARWIILTLCFITITGGYAVWATAKKQEAGFYRYLSKEAVHIFKSAIENYTEKRMGILENTLYLLDNPSEEYKRIWEREVKIFQTQNPELFIVLGYVPQNQLFWGSTLPGNSSLTERTIQLLMENPFQDIIIDTDAINPKIIVSNRRYHPNSAWMAVTIDIETLMNAMAGAIIGYGEGLAITWDGYVLYQSHSDSKRYRDLYGATTTVPILSPPLFLEAWPTAKLLARVSTPLPDLVLCFGLSVVVLAGVILYYAEVARRRGLLYRQSEAEKSAFFANVSHEIRTQLQGIIGTGSVLEMTELTPKQQKMIHMIKSSGGVLQRLLSDLLDITKVQMGNMELNPGPTALRDILIDVVDLQRSKAYEKNLEMNLRLDPHLPPVIVIDEARLEQILSNLIGNAIKFTMKGSITVSATTNFLQEPSKTLLVIKVSDTGPGISPSDMNHIFNAFYQVQGPKNRAIVGTGLGLSISKTITEYMGGSLTCQSMEGSGSTFTLMIPVEVIQANED